MVGSLAMATGGVYAQPVPAVTGRHGCYCFVGLSLCVAALSYFVV